MATFLLCRQHSVLGGLPAGSRGYSPYGVMSAAPAPGLAFCGQYRDPSTGNYPLGNGHRNYQPSLMRFQSPDKLSPFDIGGFNAYAYCLGDPINHRDPSGRFPSIITPIRSIFGGMINLAISAVKGYQNYRIERDFAPTNGDAGSRAGAVTFGTVEAQVSRWTVRDKLLSTIGAVTASVSIGTGAGRLFTPQSEALAWIDVTVASVATAVSAYELYGLATQAPARRYPVQQVGYQLRSGTPPQETRV